MLPLLQIENLRVDFEQEGTIASAVKNLSIEIPHGKLVAIVGESGSGKSVTALSILKLLPHEANITGNIFLNENGTARNLTKASGKEMQEIRGNKIAMIFQEPMTSLNPVHTCGDQVMESLIHHQRISRRSAREKTISLFEQVQLPDPTGMLKRYPHQLSGGQKQRVMIAMAMSCHPALLIADEPTTALDVRVQKNILELIKKLQQKNNMAVLLISHDLSLVSDVADHVYVMYKGDIVESGNAKEVISNPQHEYTRSLLASRPSPEKKGSPLSASTGNVVAAVPIKPPGFSETEIVLEVRNLDVRFPVKKNLFGKTILEYHAVNNVSFDVFRNETLGLIGESGCGKTTLGRAILQLVPPTSGSIRLNGKIISDKIEKESRKELQIVFQDPYGSLNPRIGIGEAIQEPIRVHGLHKSGDRKEKAIELMKKVGLQPDHYHRYPHQFSGGQRQRICIARALSLDPSFLIFDESVSALDVRIQAQVLDLINELKSDFNFTSIFISHDLSVVHYISDRIMVMQKGKIVESGYADDIYFRPKEEYTRQLLEAIPGIAG